MKSRHFAFGLSALPSMFALVFGAGCLSAQTNVLTQHNDIGRTGQNLTETVLTPANVSEPNGFGKLYTANLDGRSFAQPLYVSSVTIGAVNHSVLYVVTEHDSVFALDANANGAVLWKASLLDQAHGATAGAIPDPQSDTGCGDIDSAEYGITGTPVINYTNATTGTLYVVSETYENGYPVQRLHALDITTGAEQTGSPVTIAATVAGTGNGSVNGTVSFDAKWDNQRTGLLYLNGTVYMGWGSHCDAGPWHGWVMGYNASTLKQTFVFLSSPNGASSGVWMSGEGLAADNFGASGLLPNGKGTAPRIFVATGNGTFDSNGDWAESVLNLNLSGGTPIVADSFTPNTQAQLTAGDTDLGSAGPLILPNQPSSTYPHLAVQLSKAGEAYLLNRDNLGGYNTSADQVLQEFPFGTYPYGLWGVPAYFNGSIYFWGANSNLQQYALNVPASGKPYLSLASQGSYTEPGSAGAYYAGTFLGASPSISANGTSNAIVWVDDWVRDQGNPFQYLFAYPASNVTTPLWTSQQNPARDFAGGSQKNGIPTVADGKVFLASDSQIQVYGLLPPNFASYNLSAFQTALTVVPGASASTQVTVTPVGSFTGTVTLSATGMPSGVTAAFTSSGGVAVLTLTAASGTISTTTPATVMITGTSGTMSQSIPISVSVSTTPGPVAVSLASAANVYGIFLNNETPTNGGFDTYSWAYSANLLGPSISSSGIPFYFGPHAQANAVSGITVPLPAGNFQSIYLAGAAVNGSQANQSFVVTYTDHTTSTYTQSLSDWCKPQNYAGETMALAMTYRISPGSGTSAIACNLYDYEFALNSAKTVSSITLPANRNVAFLAITLSGGAATSEQPQTITFGTIATQTVGTPLALTASASSGLTVSYSASPANVCTVSGSTATFLASGSCTITASQAGNSIYSAATPVTQTFTVNAAKLTSQTITFGTIATQTVGTPLTLTASASSGLTVSYSASPANVCTVSGSTATFLASGSCTITATQAGNSIYSAATPVTQTFTVNAAKLTSQTITFGTIATQTVGTPLALTASASSGLTVSYSASPANVCTVSRSTATFLAAGSCTITATQAGNGTYSAATSVSQTFAVNAAKLTPQTITFGTIATQTVGTPLTLTASASSGLTVSYSASPANVCTVSGSTATFLASGSCTITASQSGNGTYSAATSVSQTFTVNATSVRVTGASLSLAPGNGGVVTVSISGLTNTPTSLGLGGNSCINIGGCQYNLGGTNGSFGYEFLYVTNTSALLVVYVPSSVAVNTSGYAIPITIGGATVGTLKLVVP